MGQGHQPRWYQGAMNPADRGLAQNPPTKQTEKLQKRNHGACERGQNRARRQPILNIPL